MTRFDVTHGLKQQQADVDARHILWIFFLMWLALVSFHYEADGWVHEDCPICMASVCSHAFLTVAVELIIAWLLGAFLSGNTPIPMSNFPCLRTNPRSPPASPFI